MDLQELLYYTGKPLESGGTSIAGDAAPAVRSLYGKQITDEMTVLDYGAGKYARNADFFRKKGIKTFAFDPFNSNTDKLLDGWKPGKVSSVIPKAKFDVAFTCFVLNVVPKLVEEGIIKEVNRLGKKVIHITRNQDVFDSVKSALLKRDKYVYPFFIKEFNKGKEVDPATLSDKKIMDFCKFGVQTSRGFQRIPELESYGFTLVKKTGGYKVYEK